MFQFRIIIYDGCDKYPLVMRRPQGLYEFYSCIYCKSPINLYKDGETVYCRPGTLIVFSPYSPQDWDACMPRFIHNCITFTLLDNHFFEQLDIKTDTPIYLPDYVKQMDDWYAEMDRENKSNNLGKAYKLDSLAENFFVELARRLHLSRGDKNDFHSELLELFESIRMKMFEDPAHKIEYYAEKANFSVRRFEHYYRTFFDTTPNADLGKSKLMLAQDLEKAGTSAEKIAERIGFNSLEYYYKWLKKNRTQSV